MFTYRVESRVGGCARKGGFMRGDIETNTMHTVWGLFPFSIRETPYLMMIIKPVRSTVAKTV